LGKMRGVQIFNWVVGNTCTYERDSMRAGSIPGALTYFIYRLLKSPT
jgi:hypothetical protein